MGKKRDRSFRTKLNVRKSEKEEAKKLQNEKFWKSYAPAKKQVMTNIGDLLLKELWKN